MNCFVFRVSRGIDLIQPAFTMKIKNIGEGDDLFVEAVAFSTHNRPGRQPASYATKRAEK